MSFFSHTRSVTVVWLKAFCHAFIFFSNKDKKKKNNILPPQKITTLVTTILRACGSICAVSLRPTSRCNSWGIVSVYWTYQEVFLPSDTFLSWSALSVRPQQPQTRGRETRFDYGRRWERLSFCRAGRYQLPSCVIRRTQLLRKDTEWALQSSRANAAVNVWAVGCCFLEKPSAWTQHYLFCMAAKTHLCGSPWKLPLWRGCGYK